MVQEIVEVAETQGFAIQLLSGNPSDKKSSFAPLLGQMLRSGAFDGKTHANRPANLDTCLQLASDLKARLDASSSIEAYLITD